MDKLLSYLHKKTDHSILHSSFSREESVTIADNIVCSAQNGTHSIVILRVWVNGKRATSSASTLSRELVDKAVSLAKASEKEEYFYGLPDGKIHSQNRCDPKLKTVDIDSLVATAKDIVAQVKSPTTNVAQAKVQCVHNEQRTITSHGGDYTSQSSEYSVVISATGKENGTIASTWEQIDEPYLFPIKTDLKKKVQDLLHAKRLRVKAPVSLTINPLSELLQYTLFSNLSLKNVEKARSSLAHSLGQEVFHPEVQITDDPTLPQGKQSHAIDFEGMPTAKTCVVKNGVLATFLSDYNTAKHNHSTATAHATEHGIQPSNIIVEGPKSSVQTYIEVDSILGAHTCDSVTGDFSVKVDTGYFVDGSTRTPVKDFLIAGNINTVLKNILSVEKMQKHQNGVYSGALISDAISLTL